MVVLTKKSTLATARTLPSLTAAAVACYTYSVLLTLLALPATAQPESLLVQNVTKACQNQRRALSTQAFSGAGEALFGSSTTAESHTGSENLEHLEYAVADIFGVASTTTPTKLQLSTPCMKSVNRIVDLAKQGDQTPIKQLACSLGLRPGDTGDFYTCDQMSYPTEDGSDAGLTYWTMSLGHHDTSNRRLMQRTVEGSLVPDDSRVASVVDGVRRQMQHGGWHPKIGLCFPSECSHDDLWHAGPYYLQALRVNATICDHDKGNCPGEAHASAQSNATQFWLESIDQTGGHSQFGMLDFGAGFWVAVSCFLILLTVCATTPQPWGVQVAGGKTSKQGAAATEDRSNTDPVDAASATPQLRVGGAAGLIQSGGEVLRSTPTAPSLCVRLVRNWDMGRNYASLHKPDPGHPGLKMLNGVRVIAIFLVVLGHTYAFMHVDNSTYPTQV
eukprot:COSAG02_NODE_239_length_27693_cov_31.385700_12_plen_445_part_00